VARGRGGEWMGVRRPRGDAARCPPLGGACACGWWLELISYTTAVHVGVQ